MNVYIVKREQHVGNCYNRDKMALSFEEAFLFLDSNLTRSLLLGRERKRRTTSVHDINKRRPTDGENHHLFHQLKLYPERFRSYTRMDISTFNYILQKVESRLTKAWCNTLAFC